MHRLKLSAATVGIQSLAIGLHFLELAVFIPGTNREKVLEKHTQEDSTTDSLVQGREGAPQMSTKYHSLLFRGRNIPQQQESTGSE